MAKLELSSKRIQINKANLFIVVVVSVACFVTIFALTASKSLWSQRGYQARVIAQKEKAHDQLETNLKSRDQLVSQYKQFVNSSTNIIGGLSTGTSSRDGDNAKIALDALPSKYDYPALATSLEKLIRDNNLNITSITGTDDELNQAAAASSEAPVEMPFVVTFDGTTQSTQDFLLTLQRSIRPMQVQQIIISGDDSKVATSVTAKTYYLPEKTLTIKKEVVR